MTQTLSSQPMGQRHHHLRLGIWIELAAVLWMTIEASSVALFVGSSRSGVLPNSRGTRGPA